MKLLGVRINFGVLILATSGILLLLSLQFLSDGNFTLWFTAKGLFGVGVILFLLDR